MCQERVVSPRAGVLTFGFKPSSTPICLICPTLRVPRIFKRELTVMGGIGIDIRRGLGCLVLRVSPTF